MDDLQFYEKIKTLEMEYDNKKLILELEYRRKKMELELNRVGIKHKKIIFTYVMIDTTNNFYKIGKSTNILKRESTLQSEKPTIKLILFNEQNIEYKIHVLFRQKRLRGEWFKLDENDLELLVNKYNFIYCQNIRINNKQEQQFTQKIDFLNVFNHFIYDELLQQSAFLILNKGRASTSLLQRELCIGYNRACRIIDQLEKIGIVGGFAGSTPRDVLVKTEEEMEQILNKIK